MAPRSGRKTLASAAAALALLALARPSAAAAPKLVSKKAHRRWMFVEEARYDMTQVTLEFDQDLYERGGMECPEGTEVAMEQAGHVFCCPPGAMLGYSDNGPLCYSYSADPVEPQSPEFNPGISRLLTSVPMPTRMEKDLKSLFTVSCTPATSYSPLEDGPPSYTMLPSVSSNPLSTLFDVLAAGSMNRKQQEMRAAKLDPPPLPERIRKIFSEPIPNQNPKVLTFLAFHKKTEILTGREVLIGPEPSAWTENRCQITFEPDESRQRSISNEDGEVPGPATASGWVDDTPPCSYTDFAPLPGRISDALRSMKQANVTELSEGPWGIYSLVSSDAYFGCVSFLDSALIYKDEAESILSKSCDKEFGSAEYMQDPCCNRQLQASQCCAEREIDVVRRRLVGVEGGVLKPKCTTNVDQLASVFLGIESYIAARERIYDTEEGCIIQYKRESDRLESMDEGVDQCYREIFGDRGKGPSCRNDQDCTYTGRCLTSQGQREGNCALPKDNPTPYLQRCFLDKLPRLVLPVLKRLWGLPMSASESEFGREFERRTSRYSCEGPSAWMYEEQWDEQNERWTPANKTACLGDQACNYNSWEFQYQEGDERAMCENDELGGKFCGECWGENECYEVSSVPTCTVAPRLDAAQYSESGCNALGGEYDPHSHGHGCRKPVPTGEFFVSKGTCFADCFATDGPNPGDGYFCMAQSTGYDHCDELLGQGQWGYYDAYEHVAHRFQWGSEMFNEYAAKKGGMCIVDFMYDENKGWQSAGPTNCPTPFTWEVNPAEGPESKCEATICFNATYTEERCMSWEDRPDGLPEHAHLNWDRSLRQGSGACVLWTHSNLKQTCDALGWNFFSGVQFEDGRKYTQAQCDEGQCNIDPYLSKSECEAARLCTKNCETCEPGWGELPSELCYSDKVSSEGECVESRLGEWDKENKLCKLMDKTSMADCYADNSTNTWVSCDGYSYDECGGPIEGLLGCRRERWGRCENQEKCESTGECYGFPNIWVQVGQSNHELANTVCIFPPVANRWGDPECNRSLTTLGSSTDYHAHTLRSPLGCAPTNLAGEQNEELCRSAGGTVVPRPKSKAACESPYFMRCCPEENGECAEWQFNSYDKDECDKCGYHWEPAFRWSGGLWVSGTMSQLHWHDREYTSLNTWQPRIAEDRLHSSLETSREFLRSSAESRAMGCNFNRMTTAISQIACGCGEGQESCSGVDTKMTVEEEAYAGTNQNIGFGISTFNSSLDPSAGGGVTSFTISELSAQSLQNTGGDARRRLRSVSEAKVRGGALAKESSADVSCYTTVTNDKEVFVGQITGDCVEFSSSQNLQDGVQLCLSVSSDIPQDSATFPQVDFALRTGSGDSATTRPVTPALSLEQRDSGQKLCATVDNGGTYCPIRRVQNFATATTSADTSCKKNQALVEAVVEGKTVDDVTDGGSGGGDSSGGDDEAGPAPIVRPWALTLTTALLAIATGLLVQN